MQTYKLTLAYDGTDYSGWQVQLNGTAVQEIVERAVERIFGEKARVHGSGRTDAGVHALGQVAHFHVPKAKAKIPPASLRGALNGALPRDVRVMKVERAATGFHARFEAHEKTYRYQIFCGDVMDPFVRRCLTLPLYDYAEALGRAAHAWGWAALLPGGDTRVSPRRHGWARTA